MSGFNKSFNRGFTLIELMVSLVLGLLISAAAVQIYIANARTTTFQKSGSELQDVSVFGIQQLESHIRIANLGNSRTSINDTTSQGGIVLTGFNLDIVSKTTDPKTNEVIQTDEYKDLQLLTRSTGDTKANGTTQKWTGVSNMSGTNSDQLTIQYTNITGSEMIDCENNQVDKNAMVIERYFVRQSTQKNGTLVLACDAGRLVADTSKPGQGIKTIQKFTGGDTRDFGGEGMEKITNVDQFNVLLGTQQRPIKDPASGKITTQPGMLYLNSYAYNKLTGEKPPITSVKIGLIVSGSTAVLGNEDQTAFELFDQTQVLTDATKDARSKKVRNVYQSTILLRNARAI
ncbi:putative pilus assembly protein PilW [Moraxella macacae 0408225]|uniref:Putative pilus assembly protein PilW n=1 Tax=Moraxella macacae 0408225 TaxID=1230338 RepID=L2F834_9GAMM|nr:prepilin-type N-terminal cleavage/methylation domain-containing protein [Moraxella macacae]ELA08613.1 putative pilus assembly protein PilW [Moraxella macacae 0408225]